MPQPLRTHTYQNSIPILHVLLLSFFFWLLYSCVSFLLGNPSPTLILQYQQSRRLHHWYNWRLLPLVGAVSPFQGTRVLSPCLLVCISWWLSLPIQFFHRSLHSSLVTPAYLSFFRIFLFLFLFFFSSFCLFFHNFLSLFLFTFLFYLFSSFIILIFFQFSISFTFFFPLSSFRLLSFYFPSFFFSLTFCFSPFFFFHFFLPLLHERECDKRNERRETCLIMREPVA